MAVQPWQKGTVIRIQQETFNTRRFWIQLPVESFDFKPGQFVTLDLPISDKPTRRLRSYSIASWPDGTNTIELLIVLLEGGAGTTFLFNEVKEGDEIVLRGPQGVFTLPDPIDKDLYLICTGTGIAPFRSMVHHIYNHQLPHKSIHIIFGTRTQQDLLYYQELNELQTQLEGFSYLPTLSREQWEGCCGHVHAVYENLIEEKKGLYGALPPAHFYLCGWKQMIDEARQRISAKGYDKKDVHLELYG